MSQRREEPAAPGFDAELFVLRTPLLPFDDFLRLGDSGEQEREVERYGGAEGVEIAERMFEIDSEAVVAALEHLVGDSGLDPSSGASRAPALDVARSGATVAAETGVGGGR